MNTKIILTALGLAALAASPAFAQKPVHHAASDAYASAVEPTYQTQTAAPDVKALGTDPDLNIRAQLQRDWQTSLGAN